MNHPMTATGIVREERFLDHEMGAFHPESPERLRVLYDLLDTPNWRGGWVPIPARPAEPDHLLAVHDPGYLDRLSGTQGRSHTFLDPDTSACSASWDAAVSAAGGLCNAVSEVCARRIRNAFALVRPPGHHAESARAKGFCLVNNIAVAARYAQTTLGLSRILIVDWDLHHGNGTQHTFEEDPSVLYISAHQYPYYPGTGAFEETGVGEGRGYTMNIPLRAGCGDGEYAALFEEIIRPAAQSYRPDLVLVSAGMDIHPSDPLGGMGVTPRGFAAMTRNLMEIAETSCEGKLVLTLEGGYNLGGLRDSVGAILNELTERSRTDPGSVSVGARRRLVDPVVRKVREMHAGTWPAIGHTP